MDEMSGVVELPLFPLNTVLFPGQVLPLHIFEQRYQQMIRHCLADELPFGVVLLRKGHEVGDAAAEPYLVGTQARIIESTHLDDGTMDIVTLGTERFRVRRLIHDQPYLRGEVSRFPLHEPDGESADVERLARMVERKALRYIELIASAAGLEIKIGEMPDNPLQLGYLAAVAMQIDNAEKQKMLDRESVRDVLVEANSLLNRENALLGWMDKTKDWPETVQAGVTGMLMPN
jgi:Lon protease-like protein